MIMKNQRLLEVLIYIAVHNIINNRPQHFAQNVVGGFVGFDKLENFSKNFRQFFKFLSLIYGKAKNGHPFLLNFGAAFFKGALLCGSLPSRFF